MLLQLSLSKRTRFIIIVLNIHVYITGGGGSGHGFDFHSPMDIFDMFFGGGGRSRQRWGCVIDVSIIYF